MCSESLGKQAFRLGASSRNKMEGKRRILLAGRCKRLCLKV